MFKEYKTPLIEGGVYEHFKGNTYVVLCISKHEATGDLMVTYLDMEGNRWTRDASVFQETVLMEDGSWVPRFSITDNSIPNPYASMYDDRRLY